MTSRSSTILLSVIRSWRPSFLAPLLHNRSERYWPTTFGNKQGYFGKWGGANPERLPKFGLFSATWEQEDRIASNRWGNILQIVRSWKHLIVHILIKKKTMHYESIAALTMEYGRNRNKRTDGSTHRTKKIKLRLLTHCEKHLRAQITKSKEVITSLLLFSFF